MSNEEYDLIDCEACSGTGLKFEGDIHSGDCPYCGGSGYID